jgi:hypothetical protein
MIWFRSIMSSTPSPPQNTRSSARFAPYRQALSDLSIRTRTPIPSLVFSFALLHELTAIVPFVGFFWAGRQLGIGDGIIYSLTQPIPSSGDEGSGSATAIRRIMREKVNQWVDEGEVWAEKVGKRYGWFGFEKVTPGNKIDSGRPSGHVEKSRGESGRIIAGNVANVVFAYAANKVSNFEDWNLNILPIFFRHSCPSVWDFRCTSRLRSLEVWYSLYTAFSQKLSDGVLAEVHEWDHCTPDVGHDIRHTITTMLPRSQLWRRRHATVAGGTCWATNQESLG